MNISHSKPLLDKSDFKYIGTIIKSAYVAEGRYVLELQRLVSRLFKMRYAFATSSGTAGLHLALLSLNIKEGDEIIIPSYACVALLNAVNYLKAKPVFVDIEPETFNITPETVRPKINKKTKAIIITHTFGFPALTEKILEFGIPVIEDCAQAIGSLNTGRPVGSQGTISVTSFYATKMLTAGMGGIVCTDDAKIAATISDLSNQDMRDSYRIRYNYKMSDLTAGLAVQQFKKIEIFIKRRKAIARTYLKYFAGLNLKFQKIMPNTSPNYYRFVVCVPKAEKIIGISKTKGIICDRPVYKPLHAYFNYFKSGIFPGTSYVWQNALSIPIYPALSENEVARIVHCLTPIFKSL